jgi:hypothetical protein
MRVAVLGVPGVLEQKTSILCNPLDLLIYIGPIPIISALAKQTAGDVDENHVSWIKFNDNRRENPHSIAFRGNVLDHSRLS